MTTLAFTLWTLYGLFAVAGCFFSAWLGDGIVGMLVGIVLMIVAMIIHWVLV